MKSSKLKLAALDMIGTTVDGAGEVSTAFAEAFRRHGFELSNEQLLSLRGRSKREAVQELLSKLAPDEQEPQRRGDEISTTLRTLLRGKLVSNAQAMPGASDALRWLRERKVAVALSTGLDRITATSILRRLGWTTGFMDTLITADDVAQGRPNPRWIEVAMSRCDVKDPSGVLVVGDTVADLQAAAAARVGWSVAVSSGAHDAARLKTVPHQALLPSVAELVDWLTREGIC